jgi:alpha-galactosidase
MAENTSTFTGAAADGTALTAVYLTQPAAHRPLGPPAGQARHPAGRL